MWMIFDYTLFIHHIIPFSQYSSCKRTLSIALLVYIHKPASRIAINTSTGKTKIVQSLRAVDLVKTIAII
jgi:hypothetical protein